jgi:Domain of unknown function (DUF397)
MTSPMGPEEPKSGSLAWRAARRCGESTCVEVAQAPPGLVAVRDSTDTNGPILRYSSGEWSWFLREAKNGSFDSIGEAGLRRQ